VSLQRPEAQQWSYLTDGRPAGFTLQGTGTARVVTPAFYRPGSTEMVKMSGARATATVRSTADRDGHLHLDVPLGGIDLPGVLGSLAVIGLPGVPSWSGTTTVTISPAG
jgi:hypothetical protein